MRIDGGNILVVGLGRTGQAVLDFLVARAREGAPLSLFARDEHDTEPLREVAHRYGELGVEVRLGTEDADGDWDAIVMSPGVAPWRAVHESAVATGAPILSEIELAWAHSEAPFVAVTGTNGKTTTTSLTEHLLVASGVDARAVGNIDPPAIEVAPHAGADSVMVCEVSSFQLSGIWDFHPEVSVLLNITPDHLDWHGSMERYAMDKGRIFENQCGSDLAVVCVDDPGAAAMVDRARARGVRVCPVSLEYAHPGGAYVKDGRLVVERPDGPVELARVDEIPLRGDHNLLNALAASAAALEMGAEPGLVAMGLTSYEPLAHRLETVDVVGGVEFVNDSKATNPDAVVKALTAYRDRGVVLLMGGRNKGYSFATVAASLPDALKAVVAFGESRGEIARDLGGKARVVEAPALEEAVAVAAELARPGDVVLLSPGCASFDEFSGYAERGREFARFVAALPRTGVGDGG
ncbi:MAG: UDP-N-acetylmuramoyl-L-alanine--D-glutamate ligase [Coriobacteriia bacterium]